jgi:hypothetical protein
MLLSIGIKRIKGNLSEADIHSETSIVNSSLFFATSKATSQALIEDMSMAFRFTAS